MDDVLTRHSPFSTCPTPEVSAEPQFRTHRVLLQHISAPAKVSTEYRGVREAEWMPGEARIEGGQDSGAVARQMLPADSESGQPSFNQPTT